MDTYLKLYFASSHFKMNLFFKYLPEAVLTKRIKKGDSPFEGVLSRGLLQDFIFSRRYQEAEIIEAVTCSRMLDKKQ